MDVIASSQLLSQKEETKNPRMTKLIWSSINWRKSRTLIVSLLRGRLSETNCKHWIVSAKNVLWRKRFPSCKSPHLLGLWIWLFENRVSAKDKVKSIIRVNPNSLLLFVRKELGYKDITCNNMWTTDSCFYKTRDNQKSRIAGVFENIFKGSLRTFKERMALITLQFKNLNSTTLRVNIFVIFW